LIENSETNKKVYMKKYSVFLFFILLFALFSCNEMSNSSKQTTMAVDSKQEFSKGTFGYDLNFLKKYHKDLVLLEEEGTGAKVIVLPAYQGRVMTSSAQGNEGISFGWVNHEFIAAEKAVEHFNVFGGEERFWMGPEGGQFSIYFKKSILLCFLNMSNARVLDIGGLEIPHVFFSLFSKITFGSDPFSHKLDIIVYKMPSGIALFFKIALYPYALKIESHGIIKGYPSFVETDT
jgi:hypothetical protein